MLSHFFAVLSTLPSDEGVALERRSHLSAARGEFVLEHVANSLAGVIRLVKADAASQARQDEFVARLARGPLSRE